MRPINPSPVSIFSPEMSPSQKSPWHSPVPYLFGGLAAMLGLIAFALLILACSYWSLSGRSGNGDESEERDLESGEKDGNDVVKLPKVYEEKFLVIMAGQEKPTFLATPVSSKVFSNNQENDGTEKNEGTEKVDSGEKVKTEVGDREQERNSTSDDEETEDHEQQTREEN